MLEQNVIRDSVHIPSPQTHTLVSPPFQVKIWLGCQPTQIPPFFSVKYSTRFQMLYSGWFQTQVFNKMADWLIEVDFKSGFQQNGR